MSIIEATDPFSCIFGVSRGQKGIRPEVVIAELLKEDSPSTHFFHKLFRDTKWAMEAGLHIIQTPQSSTRTTVAMSVIAHAMSLHARILVIDCNDQANSVKHFIDLQEAQGAPITFAKMQEDVLMQAKRAPDNTDAIFINTTAGSMMNTKQLQPSFFRTLKALSMSAGIPIYTNVIIDVIDDNETMLQIHEFATSISNIFRKDAYTFCASSSQLSFLAKGGAVDFNFNFFAGKLDILS